MEGKRELQAKLLALQLVMSKSNGGVVPGDLAKHYEQLATSHAALQRKVAAMVLASEAVATLARG